MNVRRIVGFVAVKVKPKPVNSQNRRHLLLQKWWAQRAGAGHVKTVAGGKLTWVSFLLLFITT
jgi:transcription antitermination factor NusG